MMQNGRRAGRKLTIALVVGGVILGSSLLAASPASAATRCTSLGTDWNRIVGSCTGYPYFQVHWKCWGNSTPYTRTFWTTKGLPGLSFSFQACQLTGVTNLYYS